MRAHCPSTAGTVKGLTNGPRCCQKQSKYSKNDQINAWSGGRSIYCKNNSVSIICHGHEGKVVTECQRFPTLVFYKSVIDLHSGASCLQPRRSQNAYRVSRCVDLTGILYWIAKVRDSYPTWIFKQNAGWMPLISNAR